MPNKMDKTMIQKPQNITIRLVQNQNKFTGCRSMFKIVNNFLSIEKKIKMYIDLILEIQIIYCLLRIRERVRPGEYCTEV